jgi:pyridoxal phosphate enzyme (YggS family)
MDIKNNLSLIKSSLPERVKLIAVSKFHPDEDILEAYNAGQRIFGESRVRELTAKQQSLPQDIEWHFIGTLQTNKVKFIVPFISLIHSVDSLKLLDEINRQAQKIDHTVNILIEVHIAEETSKHGFSPDECMDLFSGNIRENYGNIRFCGLMGMATFTDDVNRIRSEFKSLRRLFDSIKNSAFANDDSFRELSMGMSDDYKTAIEEGSTMVRIGTSIFGLRN